MVDAMAKDGAARLRLRPVGAADRKKLPEYGPLGTGCPAIERAVAALYKGQNEESFWAQRIVIARAILNRPDIILADEPTGNLDTETGRKIVELLKSICATGSAIMMTTHNLHLLSEYPGVVYRFENHHIKEVTHEYSRMERSQNETEKGEKTTVAPQETAE